MMLVAVILGCVSGRVLFNKYDDNTYAIGGKNLYFLQEGVYDNKKTLSDNTKNLNSKLVLSSNDKYYVYVGITGSLNNVKRIKRVYSEKGYSINEKLIRVDNLEFINNVEQFDILLSSASNSDILTIEEVVLSNYEDLVK